MLEETFEWTKRFRRDPLALKIIYGECFPRETIRMLSGIPDPL